MHDRLLAIVGATASGKTGLALELAKRFGGEVVSADSRQVYRYMDIGTAKPSLGERSMVPHHLIDVVDPDEGYSLALFLDQAKEAVSQVQGRSRLPILVGGTGQYVWALLEGWQVPRYPPAGELRESLERRAESDGPDALHAELAKLDPQAAARIDRRNVRRVVRALEIAHSPDLAGRQGERKIAPDYDIKVLGLALDRPALDGRIEGRVDAMIQGGWIEEVRALLRRGYGPELPALSSLGYRELVEHLEDAVSLPEAVERIKRRTRRFARQQHAWFRRDDERIRWLDPSSALDKAESLVARWLDGVSDRGHPPS